MEKIIQDKELGGIELRTDLRARHYSLRISRGRIIATMPAGGDEARLLAFIGENRERLRKALAGHPAPPPLTEETSLQTATFRLHLFRTERDNFYMRIDDGILHIACPRNTLFGEEQTQELLKKMLERALRHEASRLLPQRLHRLAALHGFECNGVRISNSRSQWGSCTFRKSISLSLSLMLLPWHLIDYVLLHELCHTVEMNHSDRFWTLMDKVTGGKAQALRQELKGHQML